MWWNGTGWWWWWLAFVIIFFFLPLGYGWGYRGWGPWYRRRRSGGPSQVNMPANADRNRVDLDTGWGAGSAVLWAVLIIALIWLIAAWGGGGGGGWGGGRY